MKTKKLFTVLCLFAVTTTISAQILKVANNRTNIKSQTAIYLSDNTDGLDVTTKFSDTVVLSSGMDLIWGAFYQTQPNNPGILSLTSLSSGMGWYSCFTIRANGNTGIFNSNPSAALEIGSSSSIRQVKVNGNVIFGSDARMKDNIRSISSSIDKIKQLRSVSYNFKEEHKEYTIPDKLLNNSSINDIEKMKESVKNVPKTNEYLLNRKHYGFLAQEVQKVFPDLVYEDSIGMLSVDYIGMIPLLVDALKEQENRIESQDVKVAELEVRISKLENSPDSSPQKIKLETDEVNILSYPVLEQNVPNPFNTTTSINYYLPSTISDASIYIYDMNGTQLKHYPVSQKGKNSITIQGSELIAGMYLYSLIADGKVIDTKRMILTK